MHIHFIIHEGFEAPGAYEIWAKNKGYQISYSRLYQGDNLPQSVDHIDFLIVMGGPQSPATTQAECPHFDSKAEQAVMAAAVNAGKVVIGICLGSQLLGEALGAKFEHSPEKEIGKFPITLTDIGKTHPLFSHFGSPLEVGHWHNDMPGLTPNAEVIAHSVGCPRQIVAYAPLAFGFQCHMELTPDVVELLIANSQNDLSHAAEFKFVDNAETLRQHNYEEMNQKLFIFLDKLSERYLASL